MKKNVLGVMSITVKTAGIIKVEYDHGAIHIILHVGQRSGYNH